MKSLFKSKPRTPAELVRHTRDLLVFFDRDAEGERESKREEKMAELSKLIQDLKLSLYGNSETEPVPENCVQLTQEFFREDTFRLLVELLTRHKSTVAEFISKNYDWFFGEYNSKLLEFSDYITKRLGIKLLGDLLLDRSNAIVMTRYVSSRDNLRILMNLLRVHTILFISEFVLFHAGIEQEYSDGSILCFQANKSKLLRLLADLSTEKEDDADKAQIMEA
ncbi:putative MO25-like protein [Drosera capensis]